jgi:hypothetical protein
MVYVKGIFFGIVALIVATIFYIPVAAFVLLKEYPPPPGTVHVAVNVFALIHSPVYWLIAIAAFALGFYWQFHRT